MLTLQELVSSRMEVRQKVNATGGFQHIDTIPLMKQRSLVIQYRFTASPESKDSYGTYNTTIEFHDLFWGWEKETLLPLDIKIHQGKFVFFERPSFLETPVQVMCDCKDYYFVAWYYNRDYGSHAGQNLKPYPYVRKDGKPPGSRPSPNPDHKPFLCKHLLAMASHLATNGFIGR